MATATVSVTPDSEGYAYRSEAAEDADQRQVGGRRVRQDVPDLQSRHWRSAFAAWRKATRRISIRAVKAARAAFETGPWAKMPPSERGTLDVENRRSDRKATPKNSRSSNRSTTASR